MATMKDSVRRKKVLNQGELSFVPEQKRMFTGDNVTKGGLALNPGFGTLVAAGVAADTPIEGFMSAKDADRRHQFGDKVVSVFGYKFETDTLTVTDFTKDAYIVALDVKNTSTSSHLGRGCIECGWNDSTTNIPSDFECPICGALASDNKILASAIFAVSKHNFRPTHEDMTLNYTTSKQTKCGYCGWLGSAVPEDGICPDCGKEHVFKTVYNWATKKLYRGNGDTKNYVLWYEATAIPEKAVVSYFIFHTDTTGYSLSCTFTYNENVKYRCRDCGYVTADYLDYAICPECSAPATWEDEGESEFRPSA